MKAQKTSSTSLPQAIHDLYKKYPIPADSFARCVLFAISQPEDVDVNEILFRPTSQEIMTVAFARPGLPPSASSSINGQDSVDQGGITNAPLVVGCPTG